MVDPTQERECPQLDDVCPSRRTLLQALAGAVPLPGVLVACSSRDDTDSADGPSRGSKFNASNGSVVHGPAPSAVAAVAVVQKGDSLVIGSGS
jgi:hypothetical protein